MRANSIIPESLSSPSPIQCPHGSYLEFHSIFSFSLQVLRLPIRMFVPPVVPGSGDMDPLALHSPRLFWVGEGTLVFSISARLAVIGSLPALVVCPEIIHETGAIGVAGNPVMAHSFRRVSSSAAFHRTWSVSSVLEAAA